MVVEDTMRADQRQFRFLEGDDCLKCTSRRLISLYRRVSSSSLETFALSPSRCKCSVFAKEKSIGPIYRLGQKENQGTSEIYHDSDAIDATASPRITTAKV